MNAGDTAFVLLSAALVILMTPVLALFYGGMVRNKNVLGTIMQSLIFDVVGIYGLGGIWGAVATGLFASTQINPGRRNGLFSAIPVRSGYK